MGNIPPDLLQRIMPEIIQLRHELHAHPEIRFKEEWTSNRIAAFLEEKMIPYDRGFANGTGIVATLRGKTDRTVALRADMDALPITEETGLPYASVFPGCMHACGHDGHMAALCGAAAILAVMRDQLKANVKFIFQPGEESAGGARLMIRDGALDDVEAIFGLHGWPDLPLGVVGLRSGALMAGAQDFFVEIEGKGSHGATPHAGIDPLVAAAHVVMALQTIVSRRINPLEAAVVTVGQLHAGSGTNIIPTVARLSGTIRAFQPETMEQLRSHIAEIVTSTARAHQCRAGVLFGDCPYPPLINTPTMTALVNNTVTELFGKDAIVELDKPVMMAEDFAFYLEKVPGNFFYLGLQKNGSPSDETPRLHSPRFDFPDDALEPATQLFVAIALRYIDSVLVKSKQ